MTGKEQGVESTVVQWCMSVGCVRSKVGQLRRDSTEERLFDGVDGEGVCVLMDDTRASMTPETRVVTFRGTDGLAVQLRRRDVKPSSNGDARSEGFE